MHDVLNVTVGERCVPNEAALLAAKLKADFRIADWSSTSSPTILLIIQKLDTSEMRRKAIIAEFKALGCEVTEQT